MNPWSTGSRDFSKSALESEAESTQQGIEFLLIIFVAIGFALSCAVIVGFDDIFPNTTARLFVGAVPSEDVIAREEGIFVSEILTQQEREDAVDQVSAVFDPPDPNVARQQRELTEKVLVFIDNVRGDILCIARTKDCGHQPGHSPDSGGGRRGCYCNSGVARR